MQADEDALEGHQSTAPTAPAMSRPARRRARWTRAFLISFACLAVIAAVLYPGVRDAREAARRSACKCNLKQFGLALHNYHDANGCFPPAYIADDQGPPMHSWRVLILPYMDELALYKRYKFDEPWDGPSNVKLLDEMPRLYACPSHTNRAPGFARLGGGLGILACTGGTPSGRGASQYTSYAAVLGKHCMFRGAEPVTLADVADGSANTAMVGEVTDALILWTKPDDIDVTRHPGIGDRMGFSSEHTGGAHFLMGDGSVHFVDEKTPQARIDAIYTRDSGDQVGGL